MLSPMSHLPLALSTVFPLRASPRLCQQSLVVWLGAAWLVQPVSWTSCLFMAASPQQALAEAALLGGLDGLFP